MNRREMLLRTGVAGLTLGLSRFPLGWAAPADAKKRRVLMYTRSEGYEHDVVKRKNGQLSLAETIVTDLGKRHGFEVTCEKDGRVFLSNAIKDYDGFVFETQGNLLSDKSRDGQPPMTPDGKKVLLNAIAEGKGFVGCHCASDTFHSPGDSWQGQESSQLDPYIVMLGGEFIVHGKQQKARMKVVDHQFPGTSSLQDFDLKEEWYALKNFSPDLHVILAEDNSGMEGAPYQRPDFPATWARKHYKGRVFYTSMGHRDDVWKNELFQTLLLGGLSWTLGNVEADVTPNLAKVAPKANDLPQRPAK